MARVERFTATGEIPVQQAVLAGGFPADTSSAEALKVAAGTVGVFAELAKRRQQAKDSLAATQASKSRTQMDLEMQQFMVDNADPDTWEEGLAKIFAKYGALYAGLKMSPKIRQEQDIEQQAANDQLAARVRLAATTQDIKNDILESGVNLNDLIANDDGSKGDGQGIKQAIDAYKEALLRETTPKLAAIKMAETLKEGKKGFWINQSKLRPDDIIAQMKKKKKALGKGGEDKDGLNAKDFDDIIASAYSAKALAKKSLDIQQEVERDELGQGLQDGTITYDKINATSLDEKEQETYRLKMNAEALRKSQGLPIVVNPLESGRLGDLIPDIWRDRLTYDEVKIEIDNARFPADGNPKIDDAVYTTHVNRARTEMVRVQADSHSRIMRDVRGQLRVKEANVMALFLSSLETQEERSLASATNQQQAERANAFEEQMYEWLKENPKATRDDYEEFKARNLPHFRVWEPGMPLVGEVTPATFTSPVLTAKEISETKRLITMKKPESIAVFKEMMKRVPSDAKRQYYNRWYDIVFEEEQKRK